MDDRSGGGTPARRRRHRPRLAGLAGLVGALALTLTVAACGGGGKNGGVASLSGSKATTTTSATGGGNQDPKQAALDFSRCMRQHGIDMPDPTFNGNGGVTLNAGGRNMPKPDDPKFKAAQQACQRYLPNGGKPTKPNPQQQQQLLQFARCMRQHGIDMPDPNPSGGGIAIDGNKVSADPNSPAFKAAQQACQRYLPNAGKGGMAVSGSSTGGGK